MTIFNPYILLIVAIMVGGAYAGGRVHQRVYDASAFQKKLDAIEVETQKRMLKAQEVSTVVVTKYVKGKETVREIFRDRERAIPAPVAALANSNCTIPTWFVRMWNSGNKGQLPDAAEGIDGTRSAVVLTDVIAQHDREAEACLQKERKLEALQDWVRQQCKLLGTGSC